MQLAMTNNFEDRFFDELSKRFDRFERKLDKNTDLTRQVHGDTKQLDKRVTSLENRKTKTLTATIGDKRLMVLFFSALLIFLFIAANITHTELPSWLH